jgi:3-oxoacyl-[acyl-carrier protein] reductase
MRMKDEDWQAILDTNLTSVYRTSKAVMRGMMKARKGRIVNIASVIGLTGNPGRPTTPRPRPASSVLEVARTRNRLARHHRQRRRAGLHRHRHDARLPEERDALLGQIALGRLGARKTSPRRWRSWPPRPYITGETLHVNGGMYMP